MHDDRTLIESRLRRVLDERIRPAIHPESVPLEVGIWTAPDEPVPVAEGIAAPRTPIAVGAAWGAPGGRAGSPSPARFRRAGRAGRSRH